MIPILASLFSGGAASFIGPLIKWGGIALLLWIGLAKAESYLTNHIDEKTNLMLATQNAKIEAAVAQVEVRNEAVSKETYKQLAETTQQEFFSAKKEWQAEREKLRVDALRRIGVSKPRTLSRLGNAATKKKLDAIRSDHDEFAAFMRERM